jgi:hypothetical protein
MVRFTNISALAFAIGLLPSLVSGECKDPITSGASITAGAWNMNGVNKTWLPARLDSNNVNTANPSWDIPDGTWAYAMGEKGSRGANYAPHYTCAKLTFCNPESSTEVEAGGRKLLDEFSQQDVWMLASKEAFDACDFTDAELIGTTSATSCVEVEKDDLSTVGEIFYYASKENCEAGQKVAAMVQDYEEISSQCAAIALHVPASGRLRECDCDFSKKPFSANYPTLCAQAFQEACTAIMMPGGCCETGTCMSALEVFDTNAGQEYEIARREGCNDDIPGNCYNMDGVASDMSQDGSTDCCGQTCSKCGSELASGAVFEMCTANTPGNMTATCGRLSRYSQVDYICDFKNCPEDSYWGTKNDALFKYMGVEKPSAVVDVAEPAEKDADKDMDTDAMKDSESGTTVLSLSFAVLVGVVATLF